jgi:hypothetical protein
MPPPAPSRPLVTDAATLQKSVCSTAANPGERSYCAGFVAKLAVASRDTNDLVALAGTIIKDDLALRNAAPAKLSYSLQYLMLQQQMQNESRAFTALSNIMKTKHDTVKNSISNVR